jgi:hypothetical protein
MTTGRARRLRGAAPAATRQDLVACQRFTAHGAQLQDPKRAVDVSDRTMTIAQIDESFRLLSEPVAYGDGFFWRGT